MKHTSFLFLLISILTIATSSAQQAMLKGKVLDKNTGEPIPYATIIAEDSETRADSVAVSDFDGIFTIKPLAPGKYNIKASYIGYKPVLIKDVLIRAGQNITYNIEMEQTAIEITSYEVVDYKIPLIDKDKTTVGGTVTAEEISKMPSNDYDGKKKSVPRKEPESPSSPVIQDKSVTDEYQGSIKSGLLTASELNDFSKWELWQDIEKNDLKQFRKIWELYPNNRYSVQVNSAEDKAVTDATVLLKDSKGKVIWSAKTDNTGKAELWSGMFSESPSRRMMIVVDYNHKEYCYEKPTLFQNGINALKIPEACNIPDQADIAFVVDATGSMQDEMNYLKAELLDIINSVRERNADVAFNLGSVFYRDKGDIYLTRKVDFTSNVTQALSFINDQSAEGGGDDEEAVDEALEVAVDSLSWSKNARARLLFLLLDAPPHQQPESIDKLHIYTKRAAEKGIRIIPIIASGAPSSASKLEYLMRSIALATNGSYVFLTDHSKIGNPHAKPVTDEYDVELLNNLIKRLIYQYCYAVRCGEQINPEGIKDTTLIFSSSVIAHETIDITRRKEIVCPEYHLKDFTIVDKTDTLKPEGPSADSLMIDNPFENQEGAVTGNPVIKFYPNPTSGKITVEINAKIDELFLTDISGKVLSKINFTNKNQLEIDLSSYSSGIYFLKFRENNSWHAGKILLSR